MEEEKAIEEIKAALKAHLSYVVATVGYKDPVTGERVTKPRYSPEVVKKVLNDENFVINEIIAGNNPMDCKKYIPEEILSAHPIYYAKMVEKMPEFLHYVPKDIREQNPEMCINVLKKNGWLLHSVPNSVQEQYPQDVLEAVKKSHFAIQFLSPEVQSENQNFIMSIIKEDSAMIRYVDPNIVHLNMNTLIDYMETDIKENTGNPQFAYSALHEVLSKYYGNKKLEIPPRVADLIKKGQGLRSRYEDREYGRAFQTLTGKGKDAIPQETGKKVDLPAYQGIFEKTKGRLKEVWARLKGLISRDKDQQQGEKSNDNPDIEEPGDR